jgi:hypothetical protein
MIYEVWHETCCIDFLYREVRMSDMELERTKAPELGYFFAGIPQPDAAMALTEIHGDKWCVFGDAGISDFVNDALRYSKTQVFGFPLSK